MKHDETPRSKHKFAKGEGVNDLHNTRNVTSAALSAIIIKFVIFAKFCTIKDVVKMQFRILGVVTLYLVRAQVCLNIFLTHEAMKPEIL